MKNILITGATGFVGSNLVKYLKQSAKYNVHVLFRSLPPFPNEKNITAHQLSPHFENIKDVFINTNFDCVIHLATHYSHFTNMESVNDTLTANINLGTNILQAMLDSGCNKIINTTTSAEFDINGKYKPNSLYAATKKSFRDIIHFYINCHNFFCTDLVMYDNYGPGDKRHKVINHIKNSAYEDKVIDLSPGNQMLNLVHINDTISAIHKSLAKILSEDQPTYTLECVTSAELISLKQLVSLFANVIGKDIKVNWGAKPYRPNEIMTPWVGKAVQNWYPTISLEEGLRTIL